MERSIGKRSIRLGRWCKGRKQRAKEDKDGGKAEDGKEPDALQRQLFQSNFIIGNF